MATPTIFSFTLQDTNGIKATTRAYVGYDGAVETVNALEGSWAELGGAIDDASNAQIVGGGILIPAAPDGGWKSAPVAGTDVSDVIVMNMITAATKYALGIDLPAFLPAMLIGGKVDPTNALLAALFHILDNTVGGTSIDYLNTAGQTLTALRDTFQSDRKSRRLPSLSKSFP